MAEEKKQTLVYSIIEFLNESIADGTVKQEDQESLEVAIQCIGEAFGVDPDNKEQTEKLSIAPAKLLNVFDVFLKTRQRTQGSSSSAPDSGATASTSSPGPKGPSAADKAAADALKQKGNALMSSKKYDEAIAEYTKAIDLDGTNPVFFSNRAAAHASKGDHLSAIGDAEQAILIDPKFVKAYSRLGHAQYSIGDFDAAADAFKRGLELEPGNANLQSGLDNAKNRIASEAGASRGTPSAPAARSGGPGGGGLADLLQGMGGGAGAGGAGRGRGGAPDLSSLLGSLGGGAGGGAPDLSSLLSNPAIMQMASQLAASGGLDSLMSNPAVADMANRFRSGNTPSVEEMMNDPTIRNMAEQFGGGGAGRQ
ncbi:cytoplasmic protein [Coprinopsis sp. MPI-PUGE-AT-0042]|nr:cytoplasmic protein [Coprinopsis sp. MPI-PUGE-AT-0042]